MLELFLVLGAVAAFLVYGRIAVDVLARGQGKVTVEGLGLADIMLGAMLIGIFGYMAVAGYTAEVPEEPKLSWEVSVGNAVFFGMLIAAIVLSLRGRGINFARMTNLFGVPFGRAALSAFFLAAFAFPLVFGVQAFALRHTGSEEQIIVKVLRNTANWPDRTALVLSAVVVAPLCEEIIFRGYLYPLIKRYGGLSIGILVNASLFALVHSHGPTLAPLFVLAVCLTLAYEISGSLLVPILIHSLFNGSMLVGIFSGVGDK